jgi:hypothetical protein
MRPPPPSSSLVVTAAGFEGELGAEALFFAAN